MSKATYPLKLPTSIKAAAALRRLRRFSRGGSLSSCLDFRPPAPGIGARRKKQSPP